MKEWIKKLEKQITKHDTLVTSLFFLVVVTSTAFIVRLEAGDELWNFSNIYKMNYGEMIYRDCNVIITPLFFQIGLFLFKIFGENFLVFRIYNVLIFTALYIVIYQMLKQLKVRKLNAFFYTSIIAIITYSLIPSGANYNILGIVLCALGILTMHKIKKPMLSDIVQGSIIFLIFMGKQNIGVYYMIAIAIYSVIVNENKKEMIIRLVRKFFVAAIWLGLFLVYLQLNQNLFSFLNYAVLGIGEFTNENTYWFNLNFPMIIAEIAICIILFFICFYKKTKEKIVKEQRNGILLLTTVGAMMILTSLPIINQYHQTLSFVIILVAFLYTIEIMLGELMNVKIVDNVKKIIIVIVFIAMIVLNIICNGGWIEEINKQKNTNNPYYGVIIEEELQKNIDTMYQYIKKQKENGYEVKILSYHSSLYMNLLKQNNGEMDLPFLGNLGIEGEEGLIKKINQLKNTKLLMTKEKDTIYQESEKVRKYVMTSFKQEGEIEQFYIYQMNE